MEFLVISYLILYEYMYVRISEMAGATQCLRREAQLGGVEGSARFDAEPQCCQVHPGSRRP